MKKVLFVATVVKKHINVFHIPYLKWFKENGYETHVCAKNDFEDKEKILIPYCDKYYDLPFERSPFKANNLKVYKDLKKIIENNKYDIIHCHTPIGGALTRIAAKSSRNNGTKVIYTAHGFHFFKKAPLRNWIIFYPIEKWLSKYTDCLITINNEDFQISKKNFKAKSIKMVNGVGVDTSNFKPQTTAGKLKVRQELGYTDKAFILIYVGELSNRKHQDLLIKSLVELKDIPELKLLLVGNGDLLNVYQQQVIDLGLQNRVEFLGFRNDINDLMVISDIAVSSSRQEGLPVNVMESMATGLPLIVTDCRGNRDLVTNNKNGFVVRIGEPEAFSAKIKELYKNPNLAQSFRKENLELIQKYELDTVLKEMQNMYRGVENL